ncbi:carbohydrate ABC transporter permease [Paenactinomyces guangxiensis]|uniref:Carbohydrate ABC transporter permease n=1 Tax=Paenactinomyces guangxiensis TaxID=1490290 RepID=A0A7W1WR21_9BACL|nr:carbohydrate ABC transporter permease [Paenactinomyces guangxiensis]MBA4494354.1 carbohydrate ABC transporter permease [Paenactinomyces guangxiensis]MBH8591591.1 carbohydrate ABC transporter permease [Paenactinomyces guangxiensis]
MRKTWKQLLVHLMLILIFTGLLFPVGVMLSTSLKTFDGVFAWPPQWIPDPPEWSNYVDVWLGEYHLEQPFFNSLLISASTAVITVILAFPAAYALSRFSFFGRKSVLFIMLVTQMFSPVILIVGLFQIAQSLHLLNSFLGLIITNCAFTAPMAVWLLQGYLTNIPQSLEQAARVDGCSRVAGILRIILPLSAPGVAMTAIYAFIFAWNDLLIPLIFITKPELRPVSLALTDFVGQNIVYWHQMMAASVLTTLPVAIMFSFVQKFFVQGFMAGAVKE